MSENDKREKKQKKHKSKVNEDILTNTENVKVKKVKKRKSKNATSINYENIDEPPLKNGNNQSKKQTEPPEETKKQKKRASVTFTPETIDNEPETSETPSKREKTDETRLPTEEELLELKKPENIKDVGSSKRQQKRLKYEKLLADNKSKQEAITQEKSLNYLSRWKHNRSEWKFEKLRQVWLQNHMFDSSLLPDKFFDTLVEYFGGSKGKIREVLIDTCMKIVDEAENNEDEMDDVKFKRARTLLQFLQE